MDDGRGQFREVQGNSQEELNKSVSRLIEENPEHGSIFHVGEVIKIRESYFRIKAVKPRELRLKLLPRRP